MLVASTHGRIVEADRPRNLPVGMPLTAVLVIKEGEKGRDEIDL